MIDHELKIQYLNESAESLLQTSFNRVVGSKLNSVLSSICSLTGEDLIQQACQKVGQDMAKINLPELDLAFPIPRLNQKMDCQVCSLPSDDQNLLLIELHDSLLHRAKSDINDRVSGANHFVRGLAHEIRNPLGGIRGSAQLLGAKLKSRELAEYTDIIIREADRLARLVDQMQTSVVVNEKDAINIHEVLEHVRALMESEGLSNCSMVTDYDPSLPDIFGESDALIQAFLNIIRNAVDAVKQTDDYGYVKIKTRIDHQILPGSDKQDQVVKVEISDNGIGIDDGIIDHIFEPLVSSNPAGSGLGLSITAEIVRDHKGIISVSSEMGQTTFCIYLKIYENKF